MKLICPKCLREYPVAPKNGDIDCTCGGHFSFTHLKWTYNAVRLRELPPLIKMEDFSANGDKKE